MSVASTVSNAIRIHIDNMQMLFIYIFANRQYTDAVHIYIFANRQYTDAVHIYIFANRQYTDAVHIYIFASITFHRIL